MIATTRRDPRRPILVNGAAYRREMNRKPEHVVTLGESLLAGIAVALFAGAVLMTVAGIS